MGCMGRGRWMTGRSLRLDVKTKALHALLVLGDKGLALGGVDSVEKQTLVSGGLFVLAHAAGLGLVAGRDGGVLSVLGFRGFVSVWCGCCWLRLFQLCVGLLVTLTEMGRETQRSGDSQVTGHMSWADHTLMTLVTCHDTITRSPNTHCLSLVVPDRSV